jgi:hypothetical protein
VLSGSGGVVGGGYGSVSKGSYSVSQSTYVSPAVQYEDIFGQPSAESAAFPFHRSSLQYSTVQYEEPTIKKATFLPMQLALQKTAETSQTTPTPTPGGVDQWPKNPAFSRPAH